VHFKKPLWRISSIKLSHSGNRCAVHEYLFLGSDCESTDIRICKLPALKPCRAHLPKSNLPSGHKCFYQASGAAKPLLAASIAECWLRSMGSHCDAITQLLCSCLNSVQHQGLAGYQFISGLISGGHDHSKGLAMAKRLVYNCARSN
jgi:hypothetical protein